jgi:hypothetical protein
MGESLHRCAVSTLIPADPQPEDQRLTFIYGLFIRSRRGREMCLSRSCLRFSAAIGRSSRADIIDPRRYRPIGCEAAHRALGSEMSASKPRQSTNYDRASSHCAHARSSRR